MSIGIGMIPRSEFGLIFAAIGQGLTTSTGPVINSSIYTAIVVMVMITTFITPPLLGWAFFRQLDRSS